jgi:formamidopyrimidine-DNA glycosylase
MPEGPECRAIATLLGNTTTDLLLTDVALVSGRYSKNPFTGYDDLKAALPLKVKGVGVKGKFIFWSFEDGTYLWNTLGMSGTWASKNNSKYGRVKFTLTGKSPIGGPSFDEDNPLEIFYDDRRNFGTLKYIKTVEETEKKLASLGPDMLIEKVSDELFKERITKRPTWDICKALMNQTVVCGVGNYVKADALWLAGISPHRKVKDLTDDEIGTLRVAIQEVLKSSYLSGGNTTLVLEDDSLVDKHRTRLVYAYPSDIYGNVVIREKTSDGRTTHWVPEIQT